MQKTMQSLIADTEKLLYQAAGVSVQVYSQDIIMKMLQDAFDHCFSAKFWPFSLRREIKTLDGVTGTATTPFTTITQWRDISDIFRENSPHPIPTMPESFNLLDLPTGTLGRFVEPRSDAFLFTVYPLGSTGQIIAVGRQRPVNEFVLTDVVPFDHLALEYFATWSYLVDDASNAGAAAKYQALFQSRMKDLEDSEFDNVVMLNPRSEQIPTQWY